MCKSQESIKGASIFSYCTCVTQTKETAKLSINAAVFSVALH